MQTFDPIYFVDYIVKISTSDRDAVEKYIEDKIKIDGYGYQERNRKANPETLIRDDRIGKISEFAIYHAIDDYFQLSCTTPDIQAYREREKSWAADLKITGTWKSTDFLDHPLHCKSGRHNSILINKANIGRKSNYGGKDALLSSDKYDGDLMAFVSVDKDVLSTHEVKLIAITPWGFARQLLSPAKVWTIQHRALAIYFSRTTVNDPDTKQDTPFDGLAETIPHSNYSNVSRKLVV